jgi:hypothetical protein
MRARSRLTVSHTGSVSVLGGDPNPSEAMGTDTEADGSGGAGETEIGMEAPGSAGFAGTGAGAGDEETGIEARGGDGGRAGRTVLEEGAAWMRLSISSMSDCADEGWSGIVSPWFCDMATGAGEFERARRRGGADLRSRRLLVREQRDLA